MQGPVWRCRSLRPRWWARRRSSAWYLVKRRKPSDPSVRAQRSVNLDVGEVIHIDTWLPDGTASVKYRGAQWTVIQRPGDPATPGSYRVAELVGNRLLVEKV
jgi:membrane protein implicated in regulation of membrane protease activity